MIEKFEQRSNKLVDQARLDWLAARKADDQVEPVLSIKDRQDSKHSKIKSSLRDWRVLIEQIK